MNEFECKPNSYRSKEANQDKEEMKPSVVEKRVEKVVQGKVQTKKSNVHKFTDVFIPEDIANIKSYIIMDVLVPAIKKAVSDSVDMILYGETGRKNRTSGSKVSYTNYYDRKSDDRRYDEPRSTSSRSGLRHDELRFETRRDAEAVLDQMAEVIECVGYVTVSDMYDMADVTAPFTGNRYGWMSVRNGKVVNTRDGYCIELPKPSLIDR